MTTTLRSGFMTLVIAVLAALAGCSGEVAPDVVAHYRGGTVTEAELDGAILVLAPEQRREVVKLGQEALQRMIREMVVNRLLEEAAEGDVEIERIFDERRLESQRRRLAAACIGALVPVYEPASDEVEQYFADHLDEYQRASRRIVSNIFLRRSSEDDAALVARANEIRQLYLAGASFEDLAREHSQSESRHLGGRLGTFAQGQLPEALDRVIFDLEPAVPSDPISNSEGVHIFLVLSAVEGHSFSLDEVRPGIRRELIRRHREQVVDDLVQDVVLPPDAQVPNSEELEDIVAANALDLIVLRIGDYSVDLEAFQGLVAEASELNDQAVSPALRAQVLDSLVRREKLRFVCADDDVDVAAVADEVEQALLGTRLELQRERSLLEVVNHHPTLLDDYFRHNRVRFDTELRLDVRILRLTTENLNAMMAELELARREIDAGTTTFDDVATRLGATIQDVGWIKASDLGKREPKARLFVADLAEGRCSSPFSGRGGLTMIAARSAEQPRPRALNEVRDSVIRACLEDHQQKVYQMLENEMLENVGFQIVRANLERYGHAPATSEP